MRALRRLRFQPATLVPDRSTPIDRYLGRDDHALLGRWASAPSDSGMSNVVMALRDTGGPNAEIEARVDAATIWHVLWMQDEATASVTIGENTWMIAPGDSVVAPPGAGLRTEGRQLAVKIAVPGVETTQAPPTHGEERFFGYNRQTVCCRVGTIRLCRWKLTQPLTLAEHHPRPVVALALARDATIRTATAIDRLRQGELALLDPAANPIVAPDGLSYLLTVDVDPPAAG